MENESWNYLEKQPTNQHTSLCTLTHSNLERLPTSCVFQKKANHDHLNTCESLMVTSMGSRHVYLNLYINEYINDIPMIDNIIYYNDIYLYIYLYMDELMNYLLIGAEQRVGKSCEVLNLCLWVFASPATFIQMDFCWCEYEERAPGPANIPVHNEQRVCSPLSLGSLDHAELPHHQSTGDEGSSKTRGADTTHRMKHIFGAFKIMNNNIFHQNIII